LWTVLRIAVTADVIGRLDRIIVVSHAAAESKFRVEPVDL
jgi:hypothetical protein